MGGRSSISNLRMRHVVVTGIHLSWSDCTTCKIFKWHGLTFVGLEVAELENDVTFVVNCYDVGLPSDGCCKSDVTECYCVQEFVRF